MKRNQKKKKKVLSVLVLLLLVLGVTIGYAVLSQTLNITGTSTISSTTWDVHFENVAITTGSVTATTPPTATATEKKTTLTYAVGALTVPGDFYEFTVDVKNGGTVDAKLNAVPTLSGVDTDQDVYTNYTFTNADGTAVTAGQTIAAGASKKYKVRVEFDPNVSSDNLPKSAQDLTLSVSMNWVQA